MPSIEEIQNKAEAYCRHMEKGEWTPILALYEPRLRKLFPPEYFEGLTKSVGRMLLQALQARNSPNGFVVPVRFLGTTKGEVWTSGPVTSLYFNQDGFLLHDVFSMHPAHTVPGHIPDLNDDSSEIRRGTAAMLAKLGVPLRGYTFDGDETSRQQAVRDIQAWWDREGSNFTTTWCDVPLSAEDFTFANWAARLAEEERKRFP